MLSHKGAQEREEPIAWLKCTAGLRLSGASSAIPVQQNQCCPCCAALSSGHFERGAGGYACAYDAKPYVCQVVGVY